MRWEACFASAVVVSACYSAAPQPGAPCDPALDNCPSGQTCVQDRNAGLCVSTAPGDLDAAVNCYGTGLVTVCDITPTNDLMIAADRVVDTSMIGGDSCDSIVTRAAGSFCVIAARAILVSSGVKLSATGPNPLVLIATDTLTVAGTVDVASHAGGTRGASAQAACGGNDGNSGGGMGQTGAGGGGAGGSFGSVGGDGGAGHDGTGGNGGGPGGNAVAAATPGGLVGGCPGGQGGAGGGGTTGGGGGGEAGGAVALIAGTSIDISGTIDASGAGGGGGVNGSNSSGGAGGGGSGGMIALDAPTLVVGGSVFANGGGGGGGGGSPITNHGKPGSDPVIATTPADGGLGGTGGGGNGGVGDAAGTAASNGLRGTNTYCGGGGGGGAAGIIRVFGGTPSGGTFSPPPT